MIPTLLFLALSAAPSRAAEPAVAFLSGGKAVLSVTAADLAARRDARIVSVADPAYGEPKRYRAVPIKDLLTAAYGPTWLEDGVGEIFFEALDGYVAHARVPVLAEEGGMLAFADVDEPGWKPLPNTRTRPGPFYLVWTSAKQTPGNGYPWPRQVASVKSALIDDAFPKAAPRNVGEGSRAPAGWTIFQRSCISCHAMSGDGGTVGPDLNEPRGITRYRSKKELKAYIHKASAFRHTKMPDFDELTPKELDDLMAYFSFMTVQAGTK